jgi:UDP-glucose 4-epimerase
MRAVVTGGAGFMGSHLVDRLMPEGNEVVVVDNLSSGSMENIKWTGSKGFRFLKRDLKDPDWAKDIKADVVFHYAANPEVRVSTVNPRVHFDENLVTTFNVLEACRNLDIPFIVFASTSTVYGDARVPTPEDHELNPISVYGAVKLACETIIGTYSRLYGIRALILRYANVVGPRMRHGVIVDFIRKLRENRGKLEILGDGSQRKSYVYVDDAVEATLAAFRNMDKFNVYNIGSDDWISVKEIADIVVEEMGLKNVEYVYRPFMDGRGWPGDVKMMLLDISRIKNIGWRPKLSSREAVRTAVRSLLNG